MAKTYVKLRGHEVPTPESAKRAERFMNWYGANQARLAQSVRDFDDGVATDAALYIYQALQLKGLVIDGKYKYYFLRAYRMRVIAERKSAQKWSRGVELDADDCAYDLPAPSHDYEAFEHEADAIHRDVMEYVREAYPPLAASLFEIYIGLQPHTSYKRLAKMLGVSYNYTHHQLGKIRRDVAQKFSARRNILRTLL